MLDGDSYGDAVRADERAAAELGVTGVPFFLVDGRFAVPGAQDSDLLLSVLERAWARRAPIEVVVGTGVDADACGPDGCGPED